MIDKKGNLLFTIYSYFDAFVNAKTQKFAVNLLTTTSPNIIDEYGIKVGDTINKAIRSRKSELRLIANHFTNSLGAKKIYYQFSLEVGSKLKGMRIDWVNVEKVSKKDVTSQNPIIQKISWPYSSWD